MGRSTEKGHNKWHRKGEESRQERNKTNIMEIIKERLVRSERKSKSQIIFS